MKEKEFMEFLNALANDVTEYLDSGKRTFLVRYYVVDGFHFFITFRFCRGLKVFAFQVTGISNDKVTRTHEIETECVSSLFLRIPEIIFAIIRELNSYD